MLQRFVPWAVLWVVMASGAHAEVLRFNGTFDQLVVCTGSQPGSGCPSPPVSVNIPFTFTMEITQVRQNTRTESSAWIAPESPMPPPITQATFESFSDRKVETFFSINTYENAPNVPNLLSYAGRGHLWTGTDAQGRTHRYTEFINIGIEGDPRQAPGTPITFDELAAMWDVFRDTGRHVFAQASVANAITKPDGSLELSGNVMYGFRFRLCRAPGALGALAATVRAGVGGG
jgi:hypothetical protein